MSKILLKVEDTGDGILVEGNLGDNKIDNLAKICCAFEDTYHNQKTFKAILDAVFDELHKEDSIMANSGKVMFGVTKLDNRACAFNMACKGREEHLQVAVAILTAYCHEEGVKTFLDTLFDMTKDEELKKNVMENAEKYATSLRF